MRACVLESILTHVDRSTFDVGTYSNIIANDQFGKYLKRKKKKSGRVQELNVYIFIHKYMCIGIKNIIIYRIIVKKNIKKWRANLWVWMRPVECVGISVEM